MILFTGVPPQNGDAGNVKMLALRLLGRFNKHVFAQLYLFCSSMMLNNRSFNYVRSHRCVVSRTNVIIWHIDIALDSVLYLVVFGVYIEEDFFLSLPYS